MNGTDLCMAKIDLKPGERSKAIRELKKEVGFKEIVKRGKRIYGVILQEPCGKERYLALRVRAQRFRSGSPTINDAESRGVDGWAIDESTFLTLRVRKVAEIGVLEYDSGNIYVGKLEDWEKARWIDYADRGGALQRVLPTSSMEVVLGSTRYK